MNAMPRINHRTMPSESKIYVAGHTALAGSALVRALRAGGYTNLILKPHKNLELMDHDAVQNFFARECPDYVFLAVAKVGGILANDTVPADFIEQNLRIQCNV